MNNPADIQRLRVLISQHRQKLRRGKLNNFKRKELLADIAYFQMKIAQAEKQTPTA